MGLSIHFPILYVSLTCMFFAIIRDNFQLVIKVLGVKSVHAMCSDFIHKAAVMSGLCAYC